MGNIYVEHNKKLEQGRLEMIRKLSEKQKEEMLLDYLATPPSRDEPENTPDYDDELLRDGPVDFIMPDLAHSISDGMPIILTHCSAHKIKKKFRKWCGCGDLGTCDSTDHGTAYIATDYNTGMGKGFYDIIVYLRHYPISQFEVPNNNSKTWDNFKNGSNNYMLWKSAILYGPNVPGRDGNFQTGHNDTPGHLHIGTIGVEVIRTEWNCDDNVMERKTIWWALWDFHKGWRGPNNWGNEWLRCGHELDFWFRDYADWRHQK